MMTVRTGASAGGGRRGEGQGQGKAFTTQIPELNTVEIDNSIASTGSCDRPLKGLKVITYNARRGGSWLEFVLKVRTETALQNPDVILLNEMDNGMSRSGNVHTTRLMAHALGMNYAFGLEFIELTNGNKEEQVRERIATPSALLSSSAYVWCTCVLPCHVMLCHVISLLSVP
jgi:hypothetical protein